MCQITIRRVTPGKGTGKIEFVVVGDPKHITHRAKFWLNAPWANDIQLAATGKAKFQEVKSKNPEYPDEKFLMEWNGVGCPPPGRGGSRSVQPPAPNGKSETEILATLAIAARAHAIAHYHGREAPDSSLDAFARWDFDAMVDLVTGAKGKLG